MTTDERLRKLEGQLARVRLFNRCLIACIGLSLGLWFFWRSFGPETAWAQSVTRVVRANRFVLEDDNAKPRAEFSMGATGPVLMMLAENRAAAIVLSVTKEGQSLVLTDRSGNGASLGVSDGRPSLMLRNQKDRTGIDLIASQGQRELAMYESGRPQVLLNAKNGSADLFICDRNGRNRAVLGVDKDQPGLALIDGNGKPRVGLGMDQNKPILQLMDENGKPVWSAP